MAEKASADVREHRAKLRTSDIENSSPHCDMCQFREYCSLISGMQTLTGFTHDFVHLSMEGQEVLVHISEHFVHMLIPMQIFFILRI